MERILMDTKRKHAEKHLPGVIFLCVMFGKCYCFSAGEAPLTSEDMMSHVTGGLIDVLKRLGELTAVLPISAPLVGALSPRNHQRANSLSLHCTLFQTQGYPLFLGFFLVLQRRSRDPEKCPWGVSAQESASWSNLHLPNLKKQHHCLATKPLGTCSWSAFSWWPCEGEEPGKGSREAMEAASGQ